MAVLKNYTDSKYGVTIPNAYWKVELENGIVGGKDKIKVRLNCFKDKNVADTNRNKYADFDFQFVPDLNSSNNFIAQAYLYAKTLPQFAGAIDA